jgi:hypothetical protein
MDNDLDLYICLEVDISNQAIYWLFSRHKIKVGDKVFVKNYNNTFPSALYRLDMSEVIGYVPYNEFKKCFKKLDDFREQKIGEILNG